MSTEAISPAASSQWLDFVELTKPRITFMVALTTAVGFLVAGPWPPSYGRLLATLLGTALVASGASALNQVLERESDGRMRRTANRPLPAGRLELDVALAFAVALAITGMLYLVLAVNLLTAALSAFTLAAYVFVYTPMKRRSSLATLVGAVPGAVPPMMGCTAATNDLGLIAWALFGILFLWQMPHFLAIAWLYKSDYQRGGFPMLTGGDTGGARTTRQMILYSAALLPVSLLPSVLGVSGWTYFVGALVLGLAYLGYSFVFGQHQDARAARRLLLVSVLYLPGVLLLLLIDRALL